jgi:hypothetical protein
MSRLRVGVVGLAWAVLASRTAAAQTPPPAADAFSTAIIQPDLASDERGKTVEPKPEVFVQGRFSRGPIAGADLDEATQNFQITRIEAGWFGAFNDRIGVGFELQFHPLLDGAPEEIVNDAFIEFYAAKGVTIPVGQLIKPFGFDIQQSRGDREYPERQMVAGYFFPGQPDRGLMAIWNIETATVAVGHLQVYSALLNGNRFFNDNDGRLDTLLRVRRLALSDHLALGPSVQIGSQIVPLGVEDDGDVQSVGADIQYSVGAVGFRVEWVHGTRPSTLLSLQPVFTDACAPRSHTTGLSAANIVRRTVPDVCAFDEVAGDPMTGRTAHAFDVGYRRAVGDAGHLGVDVQHKSALTFNDDAVNTRIQVTLGLEF